MFFVAGWWKVFTLGAVEHARNLFVVPYADTFLPAWALWAAGVVVPFAELVGGALLLIGWKRLPAAITLGGVLILVTFGHLLAEPLHAFHTQVFPRTILLVVILVLFDEDRIHLDRLSRWVRARRA